MLALKRPSLLASASEWLLFTPKNTIYLAPVLSLKKIEITQNEKQKTITIEGKPLDSTKLFGNNFLNLDSRHGEPKETSPHIKPCPFCQLEKHNIFVQYTDVLVLRQFLTKDGVVLPMSVTGLCKKQQKKLIAITKLAKQAGLILNLQPRLIDGSMPNTDIRKRQGHLKWNSYFEDYETMIKKVKYI